MSKLTVTVTNFRPLHRTLRGFCTVYLSEVHLSIYDMAVHQHASGAHWVALPAKPLLDHVGAARRTGDGRIEYVRLLGFDFRAVGGAFSKAVVAALRRFDPTAFDETAA